MDFIEWLHLLFRRFLRRTSSMKDFVKMNGGICWPRLSALRTILQLILWHLCFPCVILFRAHLNYLVTYWITSLGEARWRGKPCFAMAFTQFVSLSWWVNTPYSKSKYESQQHLTLSNLLYSTSAKNYAHTYQSPAIIDPWNKEKFIILLPTMSRDKCIL
jgi:hypothetical protein